jgi:ubiquinone/menaquinone biosynthesis C-methylase UbiE
MLFRCPQFKRRLLEEKPDKWNSADPYEYFMGRWSKLIALVFLKRLNFPYNLSWLDIGCGTGALSEAIFRNYKPAYLCCVDPSAEFLEKAKEKKSFKADFLTGSASDLPLADNSFDIVVSGLALNFFPDLTAALSEMKRVLKKNGIIAAYVWDYAGRMEFLRLFWDAASEVDANAIKLDEGSRFPICNPDNLKREFGQAGLIDIETSSLDIDTVFTNFEDYWNPFLGGQGPAPGYLASVNKDVQDKIKSVLQKKLEVDSNGSIKLLARAIAVRGKCQQ